MARDRIFINSEFRRKIDKMKDKNLLGFSLVENKESFIIASALGINSPEKIKNKDGWFLTKNLKIADKALIVATLLGSAKDEKEAEKFSDVEKAIDYCEECAEKGFNELFRIISENDEKSLESYLLNLLDDLYAKNVEGL